jgi:two-component system phosphate regulon response regulator PhoB
VIKLLLVEDDETLGATLDERLQREGYQVTWVTTQANAQKAFSKNDFDLIILDVSLPDGTGFEFARKVRQSKTTPFLFVTAMNTAEYRLEGYELGAEEFIPKPFHLKELLIRIRHVLNTHPPQTNEVRAGDCKIDLAGQAIVRANGEREFLGARDFELLKFLITAAPRVVSRDQILDEVWGEDKYPTARTIDNAIVRLRQLLGDEGAKHIRSVRGVGYQWLTSLNQGDHE